MSTKPAVTLDMSGLSCPAPLIGAKKIVDDMESGQSLLLISDCPGTSDDLFAWARHTGNDVSVKDKMDGGRTAYLITRGSGTAPLKPNVTLDVRGVSCPGPIVEARQLLKGMRSGEVLKLVSDCPGVRDDVAGWAEATRLELLDTVGSGNGAYEFYLRKL